jgi:hypothetical protein
MFGSARPAAIIGIPDPGKNRMRWLLIVSMLLAYPLGASAVDVPIYNATAEVASRSDADREAGLRAALRAVLVKASGDAQLAQDPALIPIVARASSMVVRHGYRDSTATAADGTVQPRVLLDAEFDAEAVDGALRELGRALWPRERPTVLVWLVIDNNGNKQIASASQQSALLPLLSAAQQRGLPLMLPRMDGTDVNRINPVTLWDAPAATVIGASQRYGVNAILVARLQKLANRWSARYTLIDGRESEQWQADDALAAGVLAKAVHGSVDRLARRYAVDNSGPALGAVQIWIEGIASSADYAAVMRYLGRQAALRDVAPVAAQAGRMQVSMQVDVGVQRLQQLLALDRQLVLEPVAGDPAGFALRLAR